MKNKQLLHVGCVVLLIAVLLVGCKANKEKGNSVEVSDDNSKNATTASTEVVDNSMEVLTDSFEDEEIIENSETVSAPVNSEKLYGDNDTVWVSFEYED